MTLPQIQASTLQDQRVEKDLLYFYIIYFRRVMFAAALFSTISNKPWGISFGLV